MDRAEFDKFADEYQALHRSSIGASGETPEYFAEYKIKDLSRLADAAGRQEGARFLDFGAGVGASVPYFRKHLPGAHLTCVDVSLRSLEIARSRFGDDASFVAFDGLRLPFPEATFDYAFATCVFHHIAAPEHRQLFAEMRRVLKPDGRVMIYEHNPLNPLTVHAVNACSFDDNAVLIRAPALKATLESAGFRQSLIRYRVFFPRALASLRFLESSLGWLPMGAQYYVWARK